MVGRAPPGSRSALALNRGASRKCRRRTPAAPKSAAHFPRHRASGGTGDSAGRSPRGPAAQRARPMAHAPPYDPRVYAIGAGDDPPSAPASLYSFQIGGGAERGPRRPSRSERFRRSLRRYDAGGVDASAPRALLGRGEAEAPVRAQRVAWHVGRDLPRPPAADRDAQEAGACRGRGRAAPLLLGRNLERREKAWKHLLTYEEWKARRDRELAARAALRRALRAEEEQRKQARAEASRRAYDAFLRRSRRPGRAGRGGAAGAAAPRAQRASAQASSE